MRAMGIDIGTTTVSMVMIDGDSGKMLGSITIPHRTFLKSPLPSGRIQDPERIWEIAREAAGQLAKKYGNPDSIGMTGQMHGFLYVNREGKAVSPLYTWQDGSGNELTRDGRTYAEILREATGSAASGYGLTTHYYLQCRGRIPSEAEKMVTISDYIAMKLCGLKTPFIACDMAASWGCFDLEIRDFCRDELEELGVELSYLPRLLSGHSVQGQTPENFLGGAPVSASLGDNQASVLGSVRDLSSTVLINIGTGSQVSFGTARYVDTQGSVELRPYTKNLFLMAGAGLCGGRAYDMLEQFYREAQGCDAGERLYSEMERQARDFLDTYGKEAAWKIRTAFSGTRSNPKERGSIHGISVENFHPGAMTVGMIQGILEELYEMYQEMCRMADAGAVHMVGSGNGIRKNALMRELAEERFRMPMDIPVCQEEAAYGAAMQSLVSAGCAPSLEAMQQKIQYVPREEI